MKSVSHEKPVEKLGWRAWIVHTKLYGRSDYLSMFCSGSFGHAKPTTQGVQYNEECRFFIKTNVELTSIYLGIWPHYIGNPHTNERDLSAGVDRLPRACLTSLADLSLQLHTTSGVAEIYICNTLRAWQCCNSNTSVVGEAIDRSCHIILELD